MNPAPSELTAFAPGRVNLIGEHTDYNAGLALPFAIAEGVTVRARAMSQRRIEAAALDLGQADLFSLEAPGRAQGWRALVRGLAAELVVRGYELPGARLEISGTVPRGAGLASSAAFAVAVALALSGLAGDSRLTERGRIELAQLCSRVENDWVGVRSGLLDQLASLFGEHDSAVAIDFESLEIEIVPLALAGHRLVLLDSGEKHLNAASGYNERRAECERACVLLGIETLRQATLDDARRLTSPLGDRVRHVMGENERVRSAVGALRSADWALLGDLLNAAHESLRDLYRVSTPALERAVERLRQAGALGARLVGGGFGGHVLGLMAPGDELPAGAFEVRAGGGARVMP
jgi:galactokinase